MSVAQFEASLSISMNTVRYIISSSSKVTQYRPISLNSATYRIVASPLMDTQEEINMAEE